MQKKEIFVIGCYPNTDEKIKILERQIEKVSITGLPIIIVTHYPIPQHIFNKVDFIIYDRNNTISDWKLNYWIVHPQFIKIVGKTEGMGYHAVACLTSIMNAVLYCRDKYDIIHFIESDIDFNVEEYIFNARDHIYNKHDLFYAYEYNAGKTNLGISYPLNGIWTGIMTFDVDWFYKKVPDVRTWDEYIDIAHICERADYILEHWTYYLFKSRDMLKHCTIESEKEFNKIVMNKNLTNTGDTDSKTKIFISELDNRHEVILFFLNNKPESIKFSVIGNGVDVEKTCLTHQVHYVVFPKTVGHIKVTMGDIVKEWNLELNKTYLESKFRFYDDRLKCLEWSDIDDRNFLPQEGGVKK